MAGAVRLGTTRTGQSGRARHRRSSLGSLSRAAAQHPRRSNCLSAGPGVVGSGAPVCPPAPPALRPITGDPSLPRPPARCAPRTPSVMCRPSKYTAVPATMVGQSPSMQNHCSGSIAIVPVAAATCRSVATSVAKVSTGPWRQSSGPLSPVGHSCRFAEPGGPLSRTILRARTAGAARTTSVRPSRKAVARSIGLVEQVGGPRVAEHHEVRDASRGCARSPSPGARWHSVKVSPYRSGQRGDVRAPGRPSAPITVPAARDERRSAGQVPRRRRRNRPRTAAARFGIRPRRSGTRSSLSSSTLRQDDGHTSTPYVGSSSRPGSSRPATRWRASPPGCPAAGG